MARITSKAPTVRCEAKTAAGSCFGKGTHVYGPECEVDSGRLMYLCAAHARTIRDWANAHANDPVMCPTHGEIGPVKSYLILRGM